MMPPKLTDEDLVGYRDDEAVGAHVLPLLADDADARLYLREARLLALLLSVPPGTASDIARPARLPRTEECLRYLDDKLTSMEARHFEERVRGRPEAIDRKSTRLNSVTSRSRMPSSA